MAPLPPTPDPVVKIMLQWTRDGDPMAQTNHFWRYTGSAPASSDLSSIATAIVSGLETPIAPLCDAHTGLALARVRDVSVAEGPQGEGGAAWLGTRTGGQLAPGTAAVVNHQVDRTYRGGKPKTFFPWGTSTDLATSGLWDPTAVTAWQDGWAAFSAAISGLVGGATTLGSPCNVSYYAGGSHVVISPTTGRARNVPDRRTTPQVDNFAGHVAASLIGSQRRRNRNA